MAENGGADRDRRLRAVESVARQARPASTLRQRAAWMYYIEEMTQNDIAKALGIGRVTVVRLLAEARRRQEVKVVIESDLAETVRLQRALEKAFDLEEAVVVPVSGPQADPLAPIAAATGYHVSDMLKPGMRIGVGWGQTLFSSLAFMSERPVADLSVVSLMGGIIKARRYNPSEFAWQFSRIFQADCYLLAAPAIVDSAQTKQALLERCGLRELFDGHNGLDAVLLSVGAMTADATSFMFGFFDEAARAELIDKGAVGDLLYNFYDIDGNVVDVEVNARIMSPPIARLRAAPKRILASGGPDKVDSVLGGLRLLRPTTLITDEHTAAALLERKTAGE